MDCTGLGSQNEAEWCCGADRSIHVSCDYWYGLTFSMVFRCPFCICNIPFHIPGPAKNSVHVFKSEGRVLLNSVHDVCLGDEVHTAWIFFYGLLDFEPKFLMTGLSVWHSSLMCGMFCVRMSPWWPLILTQHSVPFSVLPVRCWVSASSKCDVFFHPHSF